MAKKVSPIVALNRFMEAHSTQASAARELGISQQYLGDLLRGQRSFSVRVLERLGLERVVIRKSA